MGPLGIKRGTGTVSYTAADFTPIGYGPYITDFSPALGDSRTLVVINGAHFTGVAANGVRFNGVSSTDASPNAAGTMISVHVPAGTPLGSGALSVTTAYGTSNAPTAFTVIGPGPYITGFSPDHGGAGTTVLIDGFHFTGATNASFNGVTGANFAVQSDTLIRVDAPAAVTTGLISVRSTNGIGSSLLNFFVTPGITNLSVSSGRTGTNVIITGNNFVGAQSVTFNGTNAAFTIQNNSTIQTTVPTGARTGLIRINTPYYSCFSSGNFTVLPTIYGFAPTAGLVGTSVTIYGANFNVGTPVVRFNGVVAAAPTGVTFNQLTAVVPAGATTGPISVTTTDGSDTNSSNFYLPPTITRFTPTNSPPGSTVTITGVISSARLV